MCVYHFSASGYDQGAYEFCADNAAAEHTAFRTVWNFRPAPIGSSSSR